MFDEWPDDRAVALDVPLNPSTRPRLDGATDPGLVTHERSVAWATIFAQHYRLLLGWLHHALLTPEEDILPRGRAFGDLLALAEVGPLLTTLPRTADGAGRAGPPFELPYTMAFPDQPDDRWDHHRDLLVEARAALAAPPDGDQRARTRLLATLAAAEDFVDVQRTGAPS